MVSGYADDSFLTIESAGDGTSHVVGAHGEVVRSIDPAEIYTIKLSLLQSSETNKFLQKMYDKDKADGSGYFPVNINDIIGREKFTSAVAWIAKPASWQRGKTQSNREWEIVAADGEFKE